MSSYYCVTFRIKNETIDGKSYQDRRKSIVENAGQGKGFWDEPTSFMLIESDLPTDAFANSVVRGLSRAHDMAFIFDPADMSACYFGDIERDDVLRSFFPLAKKL